MAASAPKRGARIGNAAPTPRVVARNAALLIYGISHARIAGDCDCCLRWQIRFRIIRTNLDWLGGYSCGHEYGQRLLRRQERRRYPGLTRTQWRYPTRAATTETGADR